MVDKMTWINKDWKIKKEIKEQINKQLNDGLKPITEEGQGGSHTPLIIKADNVSGTEMKVITPEASIPTTNTTPNPQPPTTKLQNRILSIQALRISCYQCPALP